MSFDRTHLPAPLEFFGMEGLAMSGHGKWRTAPCVFHGGGDSMRINIDTGGFICMNCNAKGGDVLAYRMAAHGEDFITAARALGCWVDDDKPPPRRPTPLPARDALQVLAAETNLVAIAAGNLAHGVALTQIDLNRLLTAASRIASIGELFA